MSDPLLPKPDAIRLLETELAETLAAIAQTFSEVRKFDESDGRSRDEFGTKRSHAIEDAVKLLGVSAELGNAIAKIKGQYNHNINVLHGDIWPPPRIGVAKPKTFEEGRATPEAIAEAVANSVDPFAPRKAEGTPSPQK